MPCDHGLRLENFQCVAHAGHQGIDASENEPMDITEHKALRRLSVQHVELMAKDENFSLQRCAGPEQPGHKHQATLRRSSVVLFYHPIRRRGPVGLGLR